MSNYIDDNFVINFSVPEVLQENMNIAEEADKNQDLGKYLAYAENIDIVAKNCYADGAITKKMWDTITSRYTQC